MQNVPGIALEQNQDQTKAIHYSPIKKGEQAMLFADLFEKHSSRVDSELATAPLSSTEQMLDAAPVSTDAKEPQTSISGAQAPVSEPKEEPSSHDKEERMTKEDLDEVKDDLKEYGMSEEEIAELEDRVESEDGLTWGQFASVVANKMADMRKVELSDDQKAKLNTFFGKFGFTRKESARLISQLENGDQAKVMRALQAKIDAMPQNKNLMIRKEEVEAFSAAMNFSKEFTSKIKAAFGKNSLAKDVKEAFTQIRQELVEMDAKDEKLVMAVGKTFAKAMGKQVKDTTIASDIKAAVDLKPRVGEDQPKSQLREDMKEALNTRREAMSALQGKKVEERQVVPEKTATEKDVFGNEVSAKVEAKKVASAKPEAQPSFAEREQAKHDSDETWNNFFGKMSDDSGQGNLAGKIQAKAEGAEFSLKTGLSEAAAKTQPQAWEKVSAPKVMKQVETAFLKTLKNGAKQLTIQLTPEKMGKLNVMLQVNGKEVNAVIKAENSETARMIADNLDVIKSSLENQGLKVEKLEVQAGLTGGQDDRNLFNQQQHNLSRDREAMAAMRSHMKAMRGENAEVAQDVQSTVRQAIHADQGLYIIA